MTMEFSKTLFPLVIPRMVLRRWISFFASLSIAFTLVGCGSEAQVPPSAERSSREVHSEITPAVPTASKIFAKQRPGPARSDLTTYDRDAQLKARLEAFREEIGQEPDPITAVEVLYAALSDSEPKIQEEAAKWLQVLVEQNEQARKKVKELQGNEYNRDVWQRSTDLLAPSQPAENETSTEERSEENG